MIAANFRRHPDALALQLPLPFGTVLRWATRKPTTVLMRAIRAARGVAFAAAGRIKRPSVPTIPAWWKEARKAARELARRLAKLQRTLIDDNTPDSGNSDGGQVTATYTGPAYWLVNAVDTYSFELLDMHGKRVATYPSSELAHRVRKDLEKRALRDYLKAQRKR